MTMTESTQKRDLDEADPSSNVASPQNPNQPETSVGLTGGYGVDVGLGSNVEDEDRAGQATPSPQRPTAPDSGRTDGETLTGSGLASDADAAGGIMSGDVGTSAQGGGDPVK